MFDKPLDIVLWLIIGAILLGIWVNARGFAIAVSSIGGSGGAIDTTLKDISGSGYKLAS